MPRLCDRSRQAARMRRSGRLEQYAVADSSSGQSQGQDREELQSISLSEVQRQTAQGYRDAIQELRRDPERGFDKLEQIGAVREVPWSDRAQAVQQAYSEAQAQITAKGQPRSVLAVATTHEEIGHVTEAIRGERTRTGNWDRVPTSSTTYH
jgi:hypothetical protein